jgi:hypothetical protein
MVLRFVSLKTRDPDFPVLAWFTVTLQPGVIFSRYRSHAAAQELKPHGD